MTGRREEPPAKGMLAYRRAISETYPVAVRVSTNVSTFFNLTREQATQLHRELAAALALPAAPTMTPGVPDLTGWQVNPVAEEPDVIVDSLHLRLCAGKRSITFAVPFDKARGLAVAFAEHIRSHETHERIAAAPKRPRWKRLGRTDVAAMLDTMTTEDTDSERGR